MKTIRESEKLSLEQCKKILNVNGNNYSDEEILKMRNWLYRYSEMTLAFLERKTNDEIIEIKKIIGKKEK
jgi:hypothetical protein